MDDPLRTALAVGPEASGPAVARALARSLAPDEAFDAGREPPPWLLPEQIRTWRQVLAALRRHGGALLADPVGSGKTYVALAVAATLSRRPTACLVPAPLVAQWRAVAHRLGVEVEVGSHEQASRGRLPRAGRGPVIIDESHHFRHPGTRRYGHVAPWLLGRPVLLLSATPVVNRAEDLAHQLLLGVRDDALVAQGVVSLRVLLASGIGAPALGQVVIERTMPSGPSPVRSCSASVPGAAECAAAERLALALEQLQLSRHPAIAALVRGVLQRAAASSPAALAGALRRYHGLLLHARDARSAGRTLSRRELRRFAGQLDDQLVLWALFEGDAPLELDLRDLGVLGDVARTAAEAAQAADPKVERLRALLADGTPTLVFTGRRETVRHLRDRLAPPPVAWCTGERAGLGPAPAPRAAVLSWFRDDLRAALGEPPRCLVVTDVAAEGLDLRRAARVVHYDLPWTPMRLEQREGRAVRLGSAHAAVAVVRFVAPPVWDAALGIEARLARKAELPGRTGLGPDGRRLWRWRAEIADRLAAGDAAEGSAVIRGEPAGVLAGFELLGVTEGRALRLSTAVGWLEGEGRWSEDPAMLAARLEAVALGTPGPPACSPDHDRRMARALDRLTPVIRARLALAGARRWASAEPELAVRRLVGRLQDLVRDAARRRDGAELAQLERAMAFVAGGHTTAEADLVRRLAEASDAELAAALPRLPPPTARWDVVTARITGIVVFEP